MSFLVIGSKYVVVALTLVAKTSVALTSVAKTSVGEKSRHICRWTEYSVAQSLYFSCINSRDFLR